MIIRLMVIDPRPDKTRASDALVYQLPENSREIKLLQELFDEAGIEYVEIKTPRRGR